MRILPEKYPLGSYKGQKEAGLFIEDLMAKNLDIYAKAIVNDMQFLGLMSSSTFNVRVGKSTLAQHLCEYYTYKVNEQLRKRGEPEITFTHKNIVFNGDKLIERSLEVPKYSALILDESDDLTGHFLSKGLQALKKFFRKSGQLNLFVILILPDFFEFPRSIAIQRSNFFIDVKFYGEFSRGNYSFYSPKRKKKLYILGKKNSDYAVVKEDFYGHFPGVYSVDEKEYRKMKEKDLDIIDEKESKTLKQVEQETKVNIVAKIYEYLSKKKDITQEDLAESIGVTTMTIKRYVKEHREKLQVTEKQYITNMYDMENKISKGQPMEEEWN